MRRYACLLFGIFVAFQLSACSEQPQTAQPNHSVSAAKSELLIYCGITMIKPMSEIAALLEQQEDCTVRITKGGSGNLMKSILHNQVGDLYLPGSDKYFAIIEEKSPGLVTNTVAVGENRAAIMVQKGNPKKIPPVLSSLADPAYAVVIGNPDSGSIGKETGKILKKKGIYAAVMKNAMYLTTDSKDLVKAIIRKEADIVINWFAASTWGSNPTHIDIIEIDRQYAQPKKLLLGLLKFSKQQELAGKFMQLASSETGQQIFKKHGLWFD
ncbi:MAG: substrate-binding domain-containing protein [Thermodesulfobacteriota bacterium]|nr:substrate-binding domain-containing protein [Thermodesulfobacteriota bacterium]